jgi:hypothetical protein
VARRAREGAHFSVKISSSHQCLSAVVPASAEPDIHLLPRGPHRPSQKIELVFSASPETVRGEPQKSFDLHRSLGQARDLAVCVLSDLEIFLSLRFYAATLVNSRTGSKSRCSRSTAIR